MRALPHALLAIVLIIGGAVVGRSVFGRGADGAGAPATTEKPPTHPVRPGAAAKPAKEDPADKHDLAGMRERFRTWAERSGGLRRELERLSVPALKDLLLEQMSYAGKGAMKENQARYSVISAALGELYRREGGPAIEWVDAIENQDARRGAMQSILTASVRDHPDVAMPWILKFIEQNGKDSVYANTFASVAFSGAAERGADEMIRVYGMFPEKLRGDPFHSTKFPAEFDFAEFHTALTGKVDLASIYDGWAARDRNGAWQGVKSDLAARGQAGARYFGSLVLAAAAKDGEEAGMKWAAERMAELPLEQRQHCLASIDAFGKLTTDGVSVMANALPPEDRKAFAAGLIGSSRGGAKAFAALETLQREQLIEVLQEGTQRHAGILNTPTPSQFSEGMRSTFREAETRFFLTPEEIQRIHTKKAPLPK